MVSDHLAGGEVGEVGREDLCSALGNSDREHGFLCPNSHNSLPEDP